MTVYSTLELVEHDASANAPESLQHDRPANAPERDHNAIAPEFDHTRTAPELNYGTDLQESQEDPIPTTSTRNEEKEVNPEEHTSITARRRKRRRTYIIIAIVCTVVAIVAIGVGVGTGLGLSGGGSGDDTDNVNESQAPQESESNMHLILNDTSMAAVTTSDGNRRLFFQDRSGAVRQALYDSSSDEWLSGQNQIVAAEARLLTPISAQVLPMPFGDELIYIHYITVNQTIGTSVIQSSEVIEIEATEYSTFAGLGDYRCSPSTRSMSISYKPTSAIDQGVFIDHDFFFEVIVLLELPDDNVAVLRGYGPLTDSIVPPNDIELGFPLNATSSNGAYWEWRDITAELLSQDNRSIDEFMISPNGTEVESNWYGQIASPFISAAIPPWVGNASLVGMVFFNLNSSQDYIAENYLTGTSATYSNASIGTARVRFPDSNYDPIPDTPYSSSPIRRSDFVMPYFWGNFGSGNLSPGSLYPEAEVLVGGLWVNGTNLAEYGSLIFSMNPIEVEGPFPFPRLATTTAYNSSSFYLYNQVNLTTFAQRSYNHEVDSWTPTTYINIDIV